MSYFDSLTPEQLLHRERHLFYSGQSPDSGTPEDADVLAFSAFSTFRSVFGEDPGVTDFAALLPYYRQGGNTGGSSAVYSLKRSRDQEAKDAAAAVKTETAVAKAAVVQEAVDKANIAAAEVSTELAKSQLTQAANQAAITAVTAPQVAEIAAKSLDLQELQLDKAKTAILAPAPLSTETSFRPYGAPPLGATSQDVNAAAARSGSAFLPLALAVGLALLLWKGRSLAAGLRGAL